MKFENLPLAAKIIVVEQFGELIGVLEEEGAKLSLYLLNDFYVEVRTKPPGIITQIEKVSESKRLERYCPDPEW